VAAQLQRGIKGKLHLGRLSGSFLTDLTIDSLNLTGPDDSVFVATGPVRVTYDPRDILDGRIIIRSADLQHPFLTMRREPDDEWNFHRVFPVEKPEPVRPPLARRAFGAVVAFHNVRVLGGNFALVLPWNPDDSLRGARRDSAVAYNLGIKEHEIRRVTLRNISGFQRTWRWTDWNATFNRIRFRQPDTTGRQFDVARLDVVEHIPPLPFRNMRGTFYWLGDTIWLNLPHFELAQSAARATGVVRWGDDKPIRWDVAIRSDTMALKDLHWVYEGLPTTGGGSMDLRIKSQRDPHVIDYIITNMDARSTGSRITGAMTYGVGGPVLEVKNVDLALAPADFKLLETLNTKPYPYPWAGTFTGTLKARGGPVNRFQVDDARIAFADRNVPGATARARGHGEIDILHPGDARFHGFALDLAHFDLRTAQFVNPDFPEIRGSIAGTATLDSIWTDVRARDATIVHTDGDSTTASRFRGSGRVTLGGDFVHFDVTAAALPLNATTFAQSYPMLPFRGEYSGTVRLTGTASELGVNADLVGDPGRLQADATVDVLAPLYRVRGRGTLSAFDVRRATRRESLPTTLFNGRFSLDLAGDSLADLVGEARLDADRSVVDSIRVFGGQVSARFDRGAVRVDSLRLESTVGLITASGGLGLTPSRIDSLSVRAVVDSLGGLRRYLASAAVAAGGDRGTALAVVDSLQGQLRASGTLSGHTRALALSLAVEGADLLYGTTTARDLTGTVQLTALPDSARGTVTVRLDTVRTASIALSRVAGRLDVLGGGTSHATIAAETPRGVRARADVGIRRVGDSTTVRVDSLAITTSSNRWTLDQPATVRVAQGGFATDTVGLRDVRGGHLMLAGRAPGDAAQLLAVRADGLPLADLGELLQTPAPLAGMLTLRGDLRGTRARPDFFFTTTLRDLRYAGVRLESVTADGRYADRRLTTSLEYLRGGLPAIRADGVLPIDLAWQPTGDRLLEEPLSARIRTDSVGLVLFESFSKSITGATGAFALDADVSGTWKHPKAKGQLLVRGGTLSFAPLGDVRLTGIEADVVFAGDSIAVRRIGARSGAGSASLDGWISVRDLEDPRFDLRGSAQAFNAIKQPRVADLDLTGAGRLTGRYRQATLTGSMTVDRGVIAVPELYQKRVISLDDPELYRVVDTSAFVARQLLPPAPSAFVDSLSVQNVSVEMGRDVWLRSAEANINLGGRLSITRGRVLRGPNAGNVQLALEGPLQTVRGTYRLNLGPVQRTFEVEGGDMRFYGDPDLDAALNINALHTVRQFSQQQGARPDVRVRVHIGGTLNAPTAELSSPDSLRVTNADLISYLVTGGPSYEIGGRNGDYTSTAARVLLSSSFSALGASATGRLCDDAQLSTAGLDAYQGALKDVSGSILSRTRFNCAKQWTDKVYVRVDAGLCQVGQLLGGANASSDPLTFADAIGLKLDYRITNTVTLSAGMDPPTSALLCTRDVNARGFAPTPRQLGFDLFRIWRF
jgi:translocation and assembly module TamB